jgi:membrane-bound lytic murein transglycosylase B
MTQHRAGYGARLAAALGAAAWVLAGCATTSGEAEAARHHAHHKASSPSQPEVQAPAETDYGLRPDAMQWADEIAARNGLDKTWVEQQLGQARFNPTVVRLIMPPPAGTAKNWNAYHDRFIEPKRVAAGLAFWNANADWLAKAQAQYGVPASVIVGIIGVETYYGRITGNFRVIDALATLAFDFPTGRKDRTPFFRGELEQFLLMCHREGEDCASVKGSYAGAIGLPQFMPSSINQHAVDFDGDGHIDLLNSPADVIGSIAHFLQQSGWQPGKPATFDVAAPVDQHDRAVLLEPDIKPSFTAADFAAHGAQLSPAGQQYDGKLALIELQNGDDAPSYIAGTENFYAVTRYNWSSYYALAVLQLGQAVEAQRLMAAQAPLKLVSWNAEWLADAKTLDDQGFWARCASAGWPDRELQPGLPVCTAYQARGIATSADYAERKLAPVRQTLAQLAEQGADVIAMQEVQSAAALEAVLPAGYRVACTTTRVDAQNLAFAVRNGLNASLACREVPTLSLEDATPPHNLRRGLELTLDRAGRKLVLLDVHLKAGCATGRLDGRTDDPSCAVLQQQIPPLEAWVEQQAQQNLPFAILGDFNRDLDAETQGRFPARSDGSDPASPVGDATRIRELWPEVNDLTPPASAMDLASVDRSAADHGHVCHENLDQLVLSVLLRGQLDPASLMPGGRLSARLIAGVPGASDHCALAATLTGH